MQKSLKEAFDSLQDARNCARPNLSFFKQLVSFEKKIRHTNSVRMVHESMNLAGEGEAKNKKKMKGASVEPTIEVPNFYKKEYPQLFKLEVNEALAGHCPMVKGLGAGTSMGGSSNSSTTGQAGESNSKIGEQEGGGKAQAQVYTTHELKPFVLDDAVSYKDILSELKLLRHRKQKKKIDSSSAAHSRPTSINVQ